MSRLSPNVEIYETSASGHSLTRVEPSALECDKTIVSIFPDRTYQTITGFGGSFTEASAYLLGELSEKNRKKIINAYFADEGSRYSLTRTHINSCDFSLEHYCYAPVEGDTQLTHFSVERDQKYLFPMIRQAMEASEEGFKLIASPWTAPPWMKDNRDWCGGRLLPEYYKTWALYFSKYLNACRSNGITVWGVTVENEPLGNDENWESMHFSAGEMNDFVKNYLKPQLSKDGHTVKILGYDQNRGPEMKHWIDSMYGNEQVSPLYDGTAVHWYESTTHVFPDMLQYAHHAAPSGYLIQTEACIDAEVPRWMDDDWYWSKEATDWGWDWAPKERKPLHPKYVPVFRYARDIIGCLNNFVDGWIDWNMVLDRRGGPNWAENWCVAPVIVDVDRDEIYFTPLYHVLSHFSRYIRPGAKRIGIKSMNDRIKFTAARNADGSIAVVLLNQNETKIGIVIELNGHQTSFEIQGKAIQTVMIPEHEQPGL